jgi:zinc transporter ZupT
MTSFWIPFVASLLAAGATTAGIVTVRHFRKWARRNTVYLASFAAGVLIAVSFVHILPTSFAMASQAPLWLLGGYLAIHLLNRSLQNSDRGTAENVNYAVGLVPLVGIGLHSFIDGMIYSLTFDVSVKMGVVTAIGMVLHEFPEGIITYSLMLRGGFAERRAAQLAFLAAAITTPLGMLVSYPVITHLDNETLGALLAVSAGALIYVGASHLLPFAEREPQRYSLLALAAGISVAAGIIFTNSF